MIINKNPGLGASIAVDDSVLQTVSGAHRTLTAVSVIDYTSPSNALTVLTTDANVSGLYKAFDSARNTALTYLNNIITKYRSGTPVTFDPETLQNVTNAMRQLQGQILGKLGESYDIVRPATSPLGGSYVPKAGYVPAGTTTATTVNPVTQITDTITATVSDAKAQTNIILPLAVVGLVAFKFIKNPILTALSVGVTYFILKNKAPEATQ